MGGGSLAGRPYSSLPIPKFSGMVAHAFPPGSSVHRQGDIREYCVRPDSFHYFGVRLDVGVGRHREESTLGIDCSELAFGIYVNPSYVVAYRPDLPVLHVFWRLEHGEVSFTAGAGERPCHISHCALWVFYSYD